MGFYRIKQDNRVSNFLKFVDTTSLTQIESQKCVYCRSEKSSPVDHVSLPFMDKPVFIISKDLKNLFNAYQEGGRFFPFFTKDINGIGLPLYVFHPFVANCLADETEYYKNKLVKTIILDKRRIGSNKIFQVGGVKERYLVVDMEILELMLYNGIYPFSYEPVPLS